ncbi:MAG: hypothetical protein WCF57_21005 [Pyrinomonadaceae bacterium]
MPSTSGYMAAAGATAAALFFVLWWMLHNSGDEAPWVPAGLAASVVMLVAAAAREVVMRRAWTRYILEQGNHEHPVKGARPRSTINSGGSGGSASDSRSAALRALSKKCADADAAGALPEVHLDAYHACKEFLAGAEEAIRSANSHERRVALRAGREHARALQKHHLLTWARASSRSLTYEAQRRVSVADKIETAMRALDVIDAARKVYPDEPELNESEMAVREFVASVKVGRWVELAERAAFKQQYGRAIERYRDALFYLARETMKEEVRSETAERIGREIENLRVRLELDNGTGKAAAHAPQKRRRERTKP